MHLHEKNCFSFDGLDRTLEGLKSFTPVEKMAIRGAFAEVYLKYFYYMFKYNPKSFLVFEIYEKILLEMSKFRIANQQVLSLFIENFNSKVTADCHINADVVLSVFQALEQVLQNKRMRRV